MQIRAFYRTPDMPTGVDHTHETTGMLPENIEKSVLASLQGLLEDPTVMKYVQEKIIAIPDHTEQMFAQATFNRMTRLGGEIHAVHAKTHGRLNHLMHAVHPDSMQA